MRNRILRLIGLSSVTILAGCGTAPQHSNTLIFGTDTKVAFDVSTSAVDAGIPSITLGYKRKEAVWMPLLANQKMGKNAEPCKESEVDVGGKKIESIEGCLFKGKAGDAEDTYSVLASFGAEFNGSADSSGVKSENGLAQYFATGLAAQKLAEKGGAQIVNANAKPEAAPEKPPTAGEAYTLVKGCAAPSGTFSQDSWNKIVYGSEVKNTKLHGGKNKDTYEDWLALLRDGNNPDLILLAKSAKTVCKT
ncbi:hypothetical protein [Endothiovibrio diazotrophicus]